VSLSTHVLDAVAGTPAAGVAVRLERRRADGGWTELASGRTGADGRLTGWLADRGALADRAALADSEALADGEAAGVHRLTFDTGAYFAGRDVPSLYPEVTITFEVRDAAEHLHLPVLLSPYAYSTYRGS
jgi:5-hydroxyisourate hydrolase